MILTALPNALGIGQGTVDVAVRKTADLVALAKRRAAAREDAAWRASFKPTSVGAGAGLGLPIIGTLLGHTISTIDPLRRASEHIGGCAITGAAGPNSISRPLRARGGLPLIGIAIWFARDPLTFLLEMSRQGPIIEYRYLFRRAYQINDFDLIRSLLEQKEGQFADSDEAGHAFQSEAGHPFRREAGRGSDLMSATAGPLRVDGMILSAGCVVKSEV